MLEKKAAKWAELALNLHILKKPLKYDKTYFMLFSKVHIFLEGHKILQNIHQLFDWQYLRRTNNWWGFCKLLWPSQYILTLISNNI